MWHKVFISVKRSCHRRRTAKFVLSSLLVCMPLCLSLSIIMDNKRLIDFDDMIFRICRTYRTRNYLEHFDKVALNHVIWNMFFSGRWGFVSFSNSTDKPINKFSLNCQYSSNMAKWTFWTRSVASLRYNYFFLLFVRWEFVQHTGNPMYGYSWTFQNGSDVTQ